MSKIGAYLRVYKVKHPDLGEIIELYSPRAKDGRTAYFINTESVIQRDSEGIEFVEEEIETGMGLQLTKKSALKLAAALLKLAKKEKK